MNTQQTKHSFTVRLPGGATREVTAFRRTPGGPWTIKPRSQGKKVWRSLGVVGESNADLALMRKRAGQVLQEIEARRFAPEPEPAPKKPAAKAVATIGKILEVYQRDIRIETDISQAVVDDNGRRLLLLIAEGEGITREQAKERPATVLTRDLVERFQDGRLRTVQAADTVARGRARRTMDGAVNKARSVFTTEALNAYRKAGLTLPDLKPFREAPLKGSWNSAAYVPIDQATIVAMDKAAWEELRPAQPAAFLTYLMMLRLGMRNTEVEHATREWIERREGFVKKDGQPVSEVVDFMVISARPGWDGPKNGTNRRVPIAPDVLEQLKKLGGEEHLLGGTAQERWDITHRDACEFVRRFLPGIAEDPAGRVKAAYELRKHFGALVASTQGLDKAAEYLGDRRDTVERHYHAWLQTGKARPLLAAELTPHVLAAVA